MITDKYRVKVEQAAAPLPYPWVPRVNGIHPVQASHVPSAQSKACSAPAQPAAQISQASVGAQSNVKASPTTREDSQQASKCDQQQKSFSLKGKEHIFHPN